MTNLQTDGLYKQQSAQNISQERNGSTRKTDLNRPPIIRIRNSNLLDSLRTNGFFTNRSHSGRRIERRTNSAGVHQPG
ncbi:hypothetical protein CEXT_165951 [Caerostris extrusa]|uniref:Uncharacterized protein n=1 Tax=Caerostris extrusa TaxID=172846 RepID=A0AAV4UXH1_CAEEX|nr:hypothetical protein CEXT_165951 [Caerostris extrusa]